MLRDYRAQLRELKAEGGGNASRDGGLAGTENVDPGNNRNGRLGGCISISSPVSRCGVVQHLLPMNAKDYFLT